MMGTFIDQQCDLPLFASPKARATDPPQSHAAARRSESFASQHRRLIVQALAAGPAGQTGIARRSGLTVAQVSKRLKELRDAGDIERCGDAVSGSGGREAAYRRCGG